MLTSALRQSSKATQVLDKQHYRRQIFRSRLFLLEMGLIAASQIQTLRQHGWFIVAFGVLIPAPLAMIGALCGWMIGLSPGGTALLAVLAGSASYIAAPAAIRVAVPSANPTLALTASLGITFPFNVFVGIPLYLWIANCLHKVGL